jgi:hypothetical protein
MGNKDRTATAGVTIDGNQKRKKAGLASGLNGDEVIYAFT